MKFLSKAKSYFYAQRARRNARAESGRSMVEMLGVLAIMGVLTVGVMLGYRYAMDRILTNSIITGVRARSVIIGQQRVLGHPLNLSEFHPDTEKDLIYGRFEVKAFNNYEYDGEESQAMEVYNIPRRVCENIRMLTFPDETITLVNGSEMGECITDGEREDTGGLHDGGDYFTAEYHNVVTFIFAGLGEACSVNQDCLEGLCCVSLEEGGRGCLPCEDPTDCDQCQEWNGTTCVNKAEGSQCSWTTGATGCCKSGVCGACPNMCLGQSCDTLCQTCDSETGACVNKDNGTDCGTCKQCKDGACVSDMTLPGCTPQCTTNADCSGGACCCTDGTCSTDCCGTPPIPPGDDECTTYRDCNGVCGGSAVVDCNGVCDGGAVEDCKGVCGGSAVVDCNGVCDGGAVEDCNGVCDGGAVEDCKGVCGGSAVKDCKGVCGGSAVVDCNGVCDGGAVEDCNGVCDGGAVIDCHGVCGGGAVKDCKGVCGGTSAVDCKGVCGGDAVVDCHGVCDGGAVEDCKGVCGGSAVKDCKGVCDGGAVVDCNGVCDGGAIVDCNGICGGNSNCNPCHESENPCAGFGGCGTCQHCSAPCNSDGQWGEPVCVVDAVCMCTNAGGRWI